MTTILPRFPGEWALLRPPEAMLTVCRESGSTAWRDRVRTPVTTMPRFLWQMLHGHTACSHLPHRSGLRCTAATFCQGRATLPLRRFARLLERFGSAVQRSAWDEGRWHGHRMVLVEGSGGSTPKTPALPDAFGQPTEQRPGCGFPKELTILAIIDHLVRMVMCPSARLQHLGVERISGRDALRWLGAPSTAIP